MEIKDFQFALQLKTRNCWAFADEQKCLLLKETF